MFDELIKVEVRDNLETLENNKRASVAAMMKDNGRYARKTDLVTFAVTGPKRQLLMRLASTDEIEDLVSKELRSEFIRNRFSLEAGSSVRDLMDEIPVYGEIWLIIESPAFGQWKIRLVKEGPSSKKGLDEFFVKAFEEI